MSVMYIRDKNGNLVPVQTIKGEKGDSVTTDEVISAMPKETWTFTLTDGTTVEKDVPLI